MQSGKSPDLHWNLEKAIQDALRYVQINEQINARASIYELIREFDESKEETHN